MKLKDRIITEVKKIYDPEIPVNIYDLGLIYNIDVSELPKVTITHTLTSVFCPAADQIIDDIKQITLCSSSTLDPKVKKEIKGSGTIEAAEKVGKDIAIKAKKMALKL